MPLFEGRLSQLLAAGGIDPGNVRPLAELCADWYTAQGGLTPFVRRSLFGEPDRRWDDPQGVPTAEHTPFKDVLLPELKTLAQLLPTTPEAQRGPLLTSLVNTFRDCGQAAGWW